MKGFMLVLSFCSAVIGSSVFADAGQNQGELVDKKLLLSYLAGKTSLTLIDVRTEPEYAESHVNGAINIPHDQITADPLLLPTDKNAPILVYCRTGRRAGMAAESLAAAGYSDVRVLPSRQLMFHDDLIVFNCGI